MTDIAAAPARRTSSLLPVVAVAGLSGFAGLGYEIVWTRGLANALGHESLAVLGVVAALFGGIALGSLLLGRRIAASARPDLWYAALESVIGAWALACIALLPKIGDAAALLTPIDASPLRQWAMAFAVPAIALLPATLAMGATIPALEAMLRPLVREGRALGAVYAANTFGAMAGTLATTFWFLPAVGLTRTLIACAALNGVCAVAALGQGRNMPYLAKVSARPSAATRAPLASLFLAGLLGIGYEVVAIRTLSQILENTVFTFAALLAVYLLGTALGAALYGRIPPSRRGRAIASPLVAATILACVAGTVAMNYADAAQEALRPWTVASLAGAVSVELVLAAMAFLLPTIAMGALFTHLAGAARAAHGHLGYALAANTAGAALAPMLFGPLLFSLIGAKSALVLIAVAYGFVALSRRSDEIGIRLAPAGLALALLATPISLRFVQVPPGGEIVWHRDGTMASVSVVRDRAGDTHLEINNHFRMGGTASSRSDYREAHIPLLLHPSPKRALFLGLGTGTTISAAADHPGVAIDGVELVPEAVDAFALFDKTAPNIARKDVIHIHTADARRYVKASMERYDVIVADVYHPWVDGTASLYTTEHFAAIRARLSDDGIFCQWLPLHQLDLPTLRIIIRTFLREFPNGQAYLAQFSVGAPLVALIGSVKNRTYPDHWLATRVAEAPLAEALRSVDLASDYALFGQFLADAPDLAAFAGEGPLNTDDHPVVSFEAPRVAYDTAESPGDRLVAFLAALHPNAGAILAAPDGEEARRLVAYWRARDRYLALGVATLESASPETVVGEIAPRLVEIVRMSPDFDSAYGPAVAMARQIAASDPDAARMLLEGLVDAAPARPEARSLLAALGQGAQ